MINISVMPSHSFWEGKRVFVTGHTGFKGGWLSLWLHMLGAKVAGYALDPPTNPSFFDCCNLMDIFDADVRGDLADLPRLKQAVDEFEPEIIFHCAAQPLVRQSYANPVETFMTNTMGTAHVLDACRSCKSVKSVVVITTDKVYENREWDYPYRECDRLGGHDPYSASKAAAEIVVDSFQKSFFSEKEMPAITTVRAGNVIGGGDWAMDRLIPDCLRSFAHEEAVVLRNPLAIRPWQHVLEPLSGYLLVAELPFSGGRFEGMHSFNFGPEPDGHVTVKSMAIELAGLWGDGASVICSNSDGQPHEAGLLKLDISSARCRLDWRPIWSVSAALAETVAWQKAWIAGENMRDVSLSQIEGYVGR